MGGLPEFGNRPAGQQPAPQTPQRRASVLPHLAPVWRPEAEVVSGLSGVTCGVIALIAGGFCLAVVMAIVRRLV